MHAAGRAEQVWPRYTDGSAREVPAGDVARLLDATGATSGTQALPDLAARAVLFVAADALPDRAAAEGTGSLLLCAVGGDPVASAEPADLLAF